MRVYHFLTAEYGVQAIQKKRLKLARFDDMNDPFELYGVKLRHSTEETQEALRNQLKTYGVLCFSRAWHNPVLWAHYGERHRGICLGFDIPDMSLLAVRYVDSIQPFAPQYLPSDSLSEKERGDKLIQLVEQIWQSVALTKNVWWKYEDEVRVLSTAKPEECEAGLDFIPFSNVLQLHEVILGVRAVTQIAEHVEAALASLGRPATLTRTRLARDRFAIIADLE